MISLPRLMIQVLLPDKHKSQASLRSQRDAGLGLILIAG
jgi:hypothetical protein